MELKITARLLAKNSGIIFMTDVILTQLVEEKKMVYAWHRQLTGATVPSLKREVYRVKNIV